MSFSKKNEYLVEQNSIFYYFYLVNSIVYIEISEKDSKVTKKRLDHNIKDFSVCLDSLNRIHMICLDKSNKLIHFFYEENLWKKRIITDFEFISAQLRDLRLYPNKDKLNLIFLRSENPKKGIWRIVHLSIDKMKWNIYEISDVYIDKYLSPYKVDIDISNNIHLVYRSLRDGKYVLLYRVFNCKYSKWSIATKLSSEKTNVINMNILCDTKNFIHIVWSYLYNKNIKVHYLKKKITAALTPGWKKSATFPEGILNFANPILIQFDGYIKLIWKQNNQFYYTETKLLKDSWSNIRPTQNEGSYFFGPITYIGDSYKDYGLIKAPLVYGYCDEETFIVGIDKADKKIGISKLLCENSFDSPLIKDKEDIKPYLKKYLEDIRPQFDDTEIIKLLWNKKIIYDNTDSNFEGLTNLTEEEIIYRLFDLHNEVSFLKEQGNKTKESIEELKNSHRTLEEMVEKILNSYHS